LLYALFVRPGGQFAALPLRPFVLAPLLQPAQCLDGRFDLVGGDVVVELGVPIEGAGDAFLRFLVELYRVAIMRGDTYGPEGKGFIRLNVGCPRSKVDLGLDALIGALGELG
jgi:hypothetical protein